MTTRNIKHIFDPKRIAVIGASDEHGCPGSIALHNLIVERGDRVVYPVTGERESVHGVQAYPDVAAVPNLPDLALVCTEAAAVPEVVAQCGEAGIQVLNESNVPVYTSPEQAVRAFMYLVLYARNRETLYETPRDFSILFTSRRGRLRSLALRQETEVLSERLSKALLMTYGIPTTKPSIATTEERAVELAHHIGFPVVLKLLSPQVTYKTEIGGVTVNLTTDIGVRSHFTQIVNSTRS